MTTKRKFRNKTRNERFNYLKNMYLLIPSGEWHVEKTALKCDMFVDGIRTEVHLKEALAIPSCGISFTLLARTTTWVERRKGKKGLMEVRWIGPEPTEEMMDELTLILDDQKNGRRNKAIQEAKLQKLEETLIESVIESVVEEKTELEMTTVGEVINDHLNNQLPSTEEIGELFVEGLKGTYGDKFNNLFKQVQEMRKQQKVNHELQKVMYTVFCQIAGIKEEDRWVGPN